MLPHADARVVDESHCVDVQGGLAHLRRTGAVVLQALHSDPQNNAAHHVEHGPAALL